MIWVLGLGAVSLQTCRQILIMREDKLIAMTENVKVNSFLKRVSRSASKTVNFSIVDAKKADKITFSAILSNKIQHEHTIFH